MKILQGQVILPALLVLICALPLFGQLTLNPSATYSCLSQGKNVASDLPSCDYLTEAYVSCNTLTGIALSSCICIPQVFSAIFGSVIPRAKLVLHYMPTLSLAAKTSSDNASNRMKKTTRSSRSWKIGIRDVTTLSLFP